MKWRDGAGGMACAFQAALRLSNVAFAAHLEISVRMGRCLVSETGASPRGWRCSSSRHSLWGGVGVGQQSGRGNPRSRLAAA
jgi:hypothetical protein